MTLEEIGCDFLFGIIRIKMCSWTTIRSASYYFRPTSPFGALIHQCEKIDADLLLRQMGIDEEGYKRLVDAMWPSLSNIFSRTEIAPNGGEA